jgi:hypothetical protein
MTDTVRRCRNCGAALTGRYCANCGVALVTDADSWPVMAKLGALAPLLLWSLPLYTVLAMKRVFGRSWKGTLLKACALFAVYMVVLFITMSGVFLYAVLQL